ncbi:class I SAM-dependent methyltransferase [Nocardia stercoris]|uniref:Class I SAM-dependent methyltransferase n=1 Tax=Nocardia stercoris TaxID=2483361 RepID=A0A3M2KSX4_9NOCA|nr:class I SAM-dependent methyltransferase [Nocardia stercoris]RMI28191.1 class I SAM-dependent methyltransferase [Nocardia stercoris]
MMSESYSPVAEFYDLAARTQTETARLLTETLADVDTGYGPVLDLGAGTGRAVETIAAALPDARILAVEPATAMRAVLLSRVVSDDDLRRRVTVLADTAQNAPLPDRLSAVVLLGMVGHLDRQERTALWQRLADRLPAGAPVIVEVIPLPAPASMPEMRFARESVGEDDYEGWISGEPAGPDLMRWRTRWTVSRQQRILRTVEYVNDWYTVGVQDLIAETGWSGLALSSNVGVLRR